MLQKTNGIVLRSVKYGETSIVTTIFTEQYGVQAYMVKGVRSSRSKQNRAGSFQPGIMLDMVVYHHPQKSMQSISQFQVAYIYEALQMDVVRNSILLFSVELLLRLLPENAPMPGLFSFAQQYFVQLDKTPLRGVANFPLYFIIQCSRELGFELKGSYSSQTPYLSMEEGEFISQSPAAAIIATEDVVGLSELLDVADFEMLQRVQLSAMVRMRLIDWYIAFMQLHTQHMGPIRSLTVLRTILH